MEETEKLEPEQEREAIGQKVLIADDEESLREMLEIMFGQDGFDVTSASDTEEAISLIKNEEFDLIVTDLKMPGDGGLKVLQEAIEKDPQVPVIMITAYASTQTAVEAMKKGAFDYIIKPFQLDELKVIVHKAFESRTLLRENLYLKRQLAQNYNFSNIIGKGKKMNEIFGLICRVADSRSTVLITGESGTGKELVAKAIHYNSPRKNRPFYSINCAGLPEQLLESELFGHKKGAFTSAVADKKGLFEMANGGTFFLDEVGDTPLPIQVKLLRFLQEREFKAVGDVKTVKVDVRLIAATNKNLPDLVQQGKFREDFFYRINVIPLHLPPLRERMEDIPLLIDHFIRRFNGANGKSIKGVRAEAMRRIAEYPWPGNVRELENAVERAVVLETGDMIQAESLPAEIQSGKSKMAERLEFSEGTIDLEKTMDEIEKNLLLKALEKANGVKKTAARFLNLSFRSFRYKLQKHDIGKSDDSDSLSE